jgi:hypothetical protein
MQRVYSGAKSKRAYLMMTEKAKHVADRRVISYEI